MTTGEKIAKLRRQAGMSQEALCEKLGISRQAVSKWENGTTQPTNENLVQLSKLFGVTISSLLDDEDINMGNRAAISEQENLESSPAANSKKEEKNFKLGVFLQGIAIIILGITNILQAYSIASLKNEMYTVRQRTNEYSSLQSQINSLENRIYSMPYASSNDENFTDYNYKIVNYDRTTNTASIRFSVMPKDYTRQTVAEIVIKCGSQNYSVQAVLENNIFVATTDVVCDDDMSVYLYLTEDGKTRSLVLDYLPNPADTYTMALYRRDLGGKWTVGNGKLVADAQVGYTVRYVMNQDMSKSSYPVKATAEFYLKDRFIHEVPCENLMNFDFIKEGKELLDDYDTTIIDNEITFFEYFDLKIESKEITSIEDVDMVIRVVDNQGYEYTLEYPALGNPAAEAVTIATEY